MCVRTLPEHSSRTAVMPNLKSATTNSISTIRPNRNKSSSHVGPQNVVKRPHRGSIPNEPQIQRHKRAKISLITTTRERYTRPQASHSLANKTHPVESSPERHSRLTWQSEHLPLWASLGKVRLPRHHCVAKMLEWLARLRSTSFRNHMFP